MSALFEIERQHHGNEAIEVSDNEKKEEFAAVSCICRANLEQPLPPVTTLAENLLSLTEFDKYQKALSQSFQTISYLFMPTIYLQIGMKKKNIRSPPNISLALSPTFTSTQTENNRQRTQATYNICKYVRTC